MNVYTSFIHIAQNWKQPRCSSIGELCHIYTMEYYSARERNKLLIHTSTWVNPDKLCYEKKTISKDYILYDFIPKIKELQK